MRQHDYTRTHERKTLFGLLDYRIGRFRKQGKEKTAENYATALRNFRLFRKGKDILLRDLSAHVMMDFQAYLLDKGLRRNTVSLYMRQLRAAYNYALDAGIITVDRTPFRNVFTGVEKTRKRALKANVVRKLIRYDPDEDKNLEFARDMFLFSIFMQGMSFVDIAHLTQEQIRDGKLTYRRKKTGKSLTIVIPPCAQAIIDTYRVKHPDCPYLFPILFDPEKGKERKFASALRTYNNRLRRISEALKLDTPLSSYVARHTWASLARWNGVKETVICEAMGHSDIHTTAIYLDSLETDTIAAANRKVINSLLKPSKRKIRKKPFSTS